MIQVTRTTTEHDFLSLFAISNGFFFLKEGPLPHDQPTYAGLPGINVFGMLCVPYNAPMQTSGKWRPVIHTSYRSKNTTIEAASDNSTEAS